MLGVLQWNERKESHREAHIGWLEDNVCTGDPVVMVTLNLYVMATRLSELLVSIRRIVNLIVTMTLPLHWCIYDMK